MATLREYFDNDFKCMMGHVTWKVRDKRTQQAVDVVARVHYEFDAYAKYMSFFVPDQADAEDIREIVQHPITVAGNLNPAGDGISVYARFLDEQETSSDELLFTKRVILYIDRVLDQSAKDLIRGWGQEKELAVMVRDKNYAVKKSGLEKPLAFISHDFRDKESIARELAIEMARNMCPVWYDEFDLKVGASLRESIEKGLKESRNCILIISPNFLANEGWTKAEFDSIYTREIIEKQNVILPVWHGVTAREVFDYSPRLADKYALQSSIGINELARLLSNAAKASPAIQK